MGVMVAVTGPTGEIGIAAATALERDPAVERIIGMARRPFDPSTYGWTKTTYRQDSEQKAAGEAVLAEVTAGSSLEAFILRPCIVAGPDAKALADAMPWNRLPAPMRVATRALPILKPVVPDPGYPLQLVHHDDVAAAISLATTSPASPGAYDLAGDGVITVSDVATALGGRPVRVPAATASAASAVIAKTPFVPSALEWLHVARTSMVMDTSKAKSELGWQPTYTSAETLQALADVL
jgi:UDP-glucose 4-epimerase